MRATSGANLGRPLFLGLQSPKPKLIWRACFSSNSSNNHPPATRKSKDSSISQALSQSQTILGLHRSKTTSIFKKWKTTSISKMEDNLNISNMEDDLNFFKNGRRPQFFQKIEDNLIFLEKERQSKFFKNGIRPKYLPPSTKLQALPFYIRALHCSSNGCFFLFLFSFILPPLLKPQKGLL